MNGSVLVRRLSGPSRLTASALIALALSLAVSGPASAQAASDAAVKAYWTAERLQHAKPMEHHPASVGRDGLPAAVQSEPAVSEPLTTGANRVPVKPLPRVAPAVAPTSPWTDGERQLYRPAAAPHDAGIAPDATSTNYNTKFTTSRVFPASGANAAVRNFPYTAVGQMFFTITKAGGIDPPGDYACSASVIAFRVIATAGHCIGSPNTSTGSNFSFYSNWLFIPADINGNAPFGSWTAFAEGVSANWANGSGSVPNSEDWGFLDMNDRATTPFTIGAVTGTLGYATVSVAGNNLTQLGYPGNLDNGNLMQQNNSTAGASGANNNWTMGSAMGPGASGGPWILNFGRAPTCSGTCLTANGSTNVLGGNYLVAVDSYGPPNAVGYVGASQFNADWTKLLAVMCAKKAGSC
jgi:V8-like Glu-specific endopeptidase